MLKFPVLPCLLLTLPASAATVEEARLLRAEAALPATVATFGSEVGRFGERWRQAGHTAAAVEAAREAGRALWQAARQRLTKQDDSDDRPLYWARLQSSRLVRDEPAGFAIDEAGRQAALAALEQTSRGRDDIAFAPGRRRILLTGFDPFLLDRNLDQSNPSGVAALWFDGRVIEAGGITAQIETAVFPVRYADFDAGVLENWLRPWLPNVDMVLTVSMGRRDFDLERYPGRRRSAEFPDNVNAMDGGSRREPIVPRLGQQPLDGPEFVEFSLPVAALASVQTPFAVHDNRWVRVVPDTRFSAGGYATLFRRTAVEGSGGGYLSNEISYRSVRLRDRLGLTLPVGHLHTPAIRAFEPDKTRAIVRQIEAMLRASLPELKKPHQSQK
ncbi:hypothetical protein [Chitinimonas lacunae]|uniref:Pyrrolidone-carboxylate peptidase n=1 Tax=Chitinimonas lacunae TaxID=1963018 RepID=A0ABV8MQR3_9NEIS